MEVLPKQHGYPLYFKGDFIFNCCFTLDSDEHRIYRLLKPPTASQIRPQTRKSLKQILKCNIPPIVEVLVQIHSKLEILTAGFSNRRSRQIYFKASQKCSNTPDKYDALLSAGSKISSPITNQ